jgi:osmotically-inducible protein OsmY
MNALKKSSLFGLLIAMLLSVSACSDKVRKNIDEASEAEREKLAESSDPNREEATNDATFNDMLLAAKGRNEIFKDPALKASDIDVHSKDGGRGVERNGDLAEDVMRAVQIARSIDDVKEVDNKLSVRSNG